MDFVGLKTYKQGFEDAQHENRVLRETMRQQNIELRSIGRNVQINETLITKQYKNYLHKKYLKRAFDALNQNVKDNQDEQLFVSTEYLKQKRKFFERKKQMITVFRSLQVFACE